MFETYRRLLLPIYFPSLVNSVVHSATIILLPLYMLELGESVATASFLVAMRGIGALLMDVPAGFFANRFGDRNSMLLGSFVLITAMGILGITENKSLIMFAALLVGAASSFALLSLMSYVSDNVEIEKRGRAMAFSAGLQRAGAMLGPLLFGFVVKYTSYQLAFNMMSILMISSFVAIAVYAVQRKTAHHEKSRLSSMFRVVRQYKNILITIGTGGLCLMMVRSARILLFPIFGYGLGLDEVMIGLLFSISSIIDMLMFYPAGQIMDNRGRKWTAVPGTLILSTSLIILPLINSIFGMLIFAVVSGIGNGITTGVLLTMGSDVAPDNDRGQFLGIWRLQTDVGQATAPLIVGSLSEFASIFAASLSIFAIGLTGASIFAFLVKETLRKNV